MAVYILMLIVLVAVIGGYVYFRLKRLAEFYKIKIESILSKAILIFLTVILTIFSVNIFYTSAIILLHIIGVSVCLDVFVLLCRIIRKRFHMGITEKTEHIFFRTVCNKAYGCGIIPILIAAIIVGYGYFNMGNVIETNYRIETDKVQGKSYKIAFVSDIHYGTIQEKAVLKNKCKEISGIGVDIVVLGGDIVEEGTSKGELKEVFEVLGNIQNKYGIYFVYGNHDRQPYTGSRTFSDDELDNAIRENHIEILEDSYVDIDETLILAGRGDAAWGNDSQRASVEKILENADRSKYVIMVDHQPIEAEENSEQGVDLELSGHTHAGQIWPVGLINEWMGTLNYGEYQIKNCKVIVSSGFAGWRYPIRTGKHSEYVIIEIN